jgi:hypothetical protein
MYSKSTEALIRRRLDPDFILPHVWLWRPEAEDETRFAVYGLFRQDNEEVGSVMLQRAQPDIGPATMQVEHLRIQRRHEAEQLRQAAALTILATSISEGRVLISDPYGSSTEERQMWGWFHANDLATIRQGFTPRLEAGSAYPIFDGNAYASGDHIDRLGAMSSV